MKHSNTSVSKSAIMRELALKGIKATRETVNGQRVWVLSDGRKFESLAQINDALKLAQPA